MEQIGLEGVFKTEAFASGLSKYTSGLSKAVSDTTSAGGALGNAIGAGVKIGVEALAGLAVAGVAAATAMGAAILSIAEKTGEMAHELEILSAKTGLSTTALQEWTFVGMKLGLTADEIADYFYRLSRAAYAASQSGKTANQQFKAFQQLGINIYDASGKLKDINLLFNQAIVALGKIKDPTLQDALAMIIFGRSAQDLMPLIKAGITNINDLKSSAESLGAVLSEDDVAAFAKFHDSLDTIGASVKGMTSTFVAQFLPGLQELANGIVGALIAINAGDFTGAIDSLAKSLFKVIDSVTKNIPLMVTKFKAGLTKLSQVVRTYLPALILLGTSLMVSIIKGISSAIPTIVTVATDIINTIVSSLVSNWPAIRDAGKDLLKGLGDGLRIGWDFIKPYIPSASDILGWIFTTGLDLSQKFKDWVGDVKWDKLSNDIANAITNIPWSTYAVQFGKMAQNLWNTIKLFLFGGTIVTGGGTADMQTKIVKGVDWKALADAIWKAFSDAVVAGFTLDANATFKTKILDVFAADSALLQKMIDDKEAYGAGKVFVAAWNVVIKPNLSFIPAWKDISFAEFLWGTGSEENDKWWAENGTTVLQSGFPLISDVMKVAIPWLVNLFAAFGQEMITLIDNGSFGLIPMEIGTALFEPGKYQTALDNWKKWIDLSLSVWATSAHQWQDDLLNSFNQIVIKLAIAWNKFMKQIGGTQIDLSTLAGAPSGDNGSKETGSGTGGEFLAPVPNRTGYSAPLGMGGANNSKNVKYDIIINNPTAEPASASVDGTMRRMNYLGYDS